MTYFTFDDSVDDDSMDDGTETEGEDLGDLADELDALVDRIDDAGGSLAIRRALEAASASLRHEGRTGTGTPARQLREVLRLQLSDAAMANASSAEANTRRQYGYEGTDPVGNPQSKEAAVEARIHGEQEALNALVAAHVGNGITPGSGGKITQADFLKAAPKLAPIAEQLCQQEYGRSLEQMASESVQSNPLGVAFIEAARLYRQRQGLDQPANAPIWQP